MPQEHPELLRISDLPDVEADYYGLALLFPKAKPTCHGTSSEGVEKQTPSQTIHTGIFSCLLGNTWKLREELGMRDISFVMCKTAGKNLK